MCGKTAVGANGLSRLTVKKTHHSSREELTGSYDSTILFLCVLFHFVHYDVILMQTLTCNLKQQTHTIYLRTSNKTHSSTLCREREALTVAWNLGVATRDGSDMFQVHKINVCSISYDAVLYYDYIPKVISACQALHGQLSYSMNVIATKASSFFSV